MSSINGQNTDITETFFTRRDIGRIFSWDAVSEIHKIRNGIYQRKGVLISLLTDFGKINPCYPDATDGSPDTIFYTGAGRRGDQRLDSFNQAMFNAIESKHNVPLFNKLSVGRWQFLGFWRVREGAYVFDEAQKRMIWKFRLEKQEVESAGGDRSQSPCAEDGKKCPDSAPKSVLVCGILNLKS